MKWAAVAGQPLAVRLLLRAIAAHRVSHAYLFVGPDGVGKRTVALQFAQTLHCRSVDVDGEPCGVCSACIKMSPGSLSHPDTLLLAPDGRILKTDQIRELRAEMYVRPTESRYRVAIIDAVDRMNAEAGNRILKLLEEPPSYAVFILLTHNLSGVLPTLVSRCQVINFSPVPPNTMLPVLCGRGIEERQARVCAALSGGSLGRAVVMAENPDVAVRRDETLSLLRKLSDMDDFAVTTYAEVLEKNKDDLDDWLEMTIVWLRDALVLAKTGLGELVVNSDREADVRWMANRYGVGPLLNMVEAVMETRVRLQRNVNARLALDVLLLRMHDAGARL